MYSRALRRLGLAAGVATTAIVLAGCSGGSTPTSSDSGDSDEPVTLTVTTFGTMGLDDLYEQYMDDHPNITIEATNIDTGGNALTDWKTKQASGGLPDIQSVEEGWLGSVMEVSDTFTDLSDYGAADIAGDWVDWKVQQATDADGRIIGYGTDIGPEVSATTGSSSRMPVCRPTARRSPSCSAARTRRGTPSSMSGRSTTTRPARRSTTSPASSGTRSG